MKEHGLQGYQRVKMAELIAPLKDMSEEWCDKSTPLVSVNPKPPKPTRPSPLLP